MNVVIAVDFDGTIADHCYPETGGEVPGAIKWLKAFQKSGAKLILWTMRSNDVSCGPMLDKAVNFCASRGVHFWGVNSNPQQATWTTSPKAYAQIYIDDAAFGCPLRENPRPGGRPYVDWDVVGPQVLASIEAKPMP